MDRHDRAQRAKMIIEDDLWAEAFALMKDAYMGSIMGCDEKDDLGRFRYTQALKDVELVQRHFEAVMQAGIAPEDLNEMKTPRRLRLF
tara:strand:+ start:2862 stop:3125 length:264 start_codon:yes stop_codon:yes gene_type:complete